MAFRWLADDGPPLNALGSFVTFQGIRTRVAKQPYIFVSFQGGGGSPVHPFLDPPMNRIVQKHRLFGSKLFVKSVFFLPLVP